MLLNLTLFAVLNHYFEKIQTTSKLFQKATREKIDIQHRMFIIPVSFAEHGKEMLGKFQHFVSKGWFTMSATEHKDLLVQMRQATFQPNGNLDKSAASNSTYDVFDSTRLALMPFHTGDRR